MKATKQKLAGYVLAVAGQAGHDGAFYAHLKGRGLANGSEYLMYSARELKLLLAAFPEDRKELLSQARESARHFRELHPDWYPKTPKPPEPICMEGTPISTLMVTVPANSANTLTVEAPQ